MSFNRRPMPTREEVIEARQAPRPAPTVKSLYVGRYGGGRFGGEVPKTTAYRDPILLEMARGRSCLLLVPAQCNHRLDTTCACHSNLGAHGKAKARKADDCYVVDGCAACHSWLDQGPATAAQKEAVFMAGHARQVLRWRFIAVDPNEPERFRRAARRALERLNATPLPEGAP